MWFTGEYLEVVENQRLVYTESMSDENGLVKSPAEMGMPDGHPTTRKSASRSTLSAAVQECGRPTLEYLLTLLVPLGGEWQSTS